MEFFRYILISLLIHLIVLSALSFRRGATVSLGIRGGEVSVFLDAGSAGDRGQGRDLEKNTGTRDAINNHDDFHYKSNDSLRQNDSGTGGDGGGRYGALGRLVAEAYRNSPPEYPAVARAMGYQGRVTLLLEVMPDGSCGTVDITKSSGHRILDLAAQRAARGWIFFTGNTFALASPVKVSQDIIFLLKTY